MMQYVDFFIFAVIVILILAVVDFFLMLMGALTLLQPIEHMVVIDFNLRDTQSIRILNRLSYSEHMRLRNL